MIKEFGFDTKAEALAFIQGVEYVNDSALTILPGPKDQKQDGVELRDGRWIVSIEDEDETREEEQEFISQVIKP